MNFNKRFKKIAPKFVTVYLLLTMFMQFILPTTIVAQEFIEDINHPLENTEIKENNIDFIDDLKLSLSTIEPEVTQSEPVEEWQFVSGKWETNSPIVTNKEYIIDELGSIKIVYSKIQNENAKMYVSETSVDGVNGNVLSAYEITSNMENGTFSYDLYLPNPGVESNNIEVKYSENNSDFIDVEEFVNNDYIVINNLDHFTIFVVLSPNPVDSNCTNSSVGIVGTDSCYNTLQEAIDHSISGDTIELRDDITITERVEFNIANINITLEGNGHTINSGFSWTSNENNAALGLFADNTTIRNLTIDGGGSGNNLHGINTYLVDNIYLDNVNLNNNGRSGLVVNSSSVVVNNISTSNSSWHGINVDDAGGSPAVLTVNGSSTHTETLPIYVDDRADITNGNVTVNANQYTYSSLAPSNPGAVYLLACTTTTVHNTNSGEYFCNMQDAIDDSNTLDSHNIEVESSYAEKEAVIIDKGIKINCQTGTLLNATGFSTDNDPQVAFTINANNVSINNCNITGFRQGIITQNNTAFQNISITNNTIYGLNPHSYFNSGAGDYSAVAIEIGKGTNVMLRDSDKVDGGFGAISGISDLGARLNYSGLVISGNTISGSNNIYAAIGLTAISGPITVSGNSITYMRGSSISLDSSSNVSISNNTLSNGTLAGIFISDSEDNDGAWGGSYDMWGIGNGALGPQNISVTNNTITNNGTANPSTWGTWARLGNNGISILSNPAEIIVTGNTISENNTYSDGVNNVNGGNGIGNFLPNIADGQVIALDNSWGDIEGPRDVWSGDGSFYDTNPASVSGDYAYGDILYKLDAPVQTGYNENNGDDFAIPRNPNEIACTGGVTSINGVSVHWTDVNSTVPTSVNLKYERQYAVNSEGWNGSEIFTNPYTNYRTFGGGSGNDGTYQSRVRTFVDLNSNNLFDSGESTSDWSNPCEITFDSTAPAVPSGLRWLAREDHNIAFACGDITQIRHLHADWDDNTESDFSHYEYTSFNAPNGDIGLNEIVFTESIFEYNGSWLPNEGTYGFAVRAVDNAGNKSDWALGGSETFADSCQITFDNTAPTADQMPNEILSEGEVGSITLAKGYDANQLYFTVEATYTDPLNSVVVPLGTIINHDKMTETTIGSGIWERDLDGTDGHNDPNQDYAIDTSLYGMGTEGLYQFNYFVEDEAGNTSPTYTVEIEIVNVAPVVTFSGNQSINIGNTANFSGSFTDPSSLGSPFFDDTNWSVSINYGDGNGYENISSVNTPGNITGLSHTYLNEGTYTVSLRVCEGNSDVNGDTLIDGEGECTIKTVFVSVTAVPQPYQEFIPNSVPAVLGFNTKEDTKEDKGAVLGARTCEITQDVSGYIYIDKNNNSNKDHNEKVLEGIDVNIYYIDEKGKRVDVITVKTDEEGQWKAKLCNGNYKIEINKTNLPKDTVIKEDTLSISVENGKNLENVNFVLSINEVFCKWWVCLLIILVLIVITKVVIDKFKEKEEKRKRNKS